MNKTILVIGSVTAEQYKTVRLECIAEAHHPRIARTTIEKLFMNEEDLVHFYGAERRVLEYWSTEFNDIWEPASNEDELRPIFSKLAEKRLAEFGDIFAVVMDEESWDHWGDKKGAVVGQVLWDKDFSRWVVTRGCAEFVG